LRDGRHHVELAPHLQAQLVREPYAEAETEVVAGPGDDRAAVARQPVAADADVREKAEPRCQAEPAEGDVDAEGGGVEPLARVVEPAELLLDLAEGRADEVGLESQERDDVHRQAQPELRTGALVVLHDGDAGAAEGADSDAGGRSRPGRERQRRRGQEQRSSHVSSCPPPEGGRTSLPTVEEPDIGDEGDLSPGTTPVSSAATSSPSRARPAPALPTAPLPPSRGRPPYLDWQIGKPPALPADPRGFTFRA